MGMHTCFGVFFDCYVGLGCLVVLEDAEILLEASISFSLATEASS